jgi:hypothetical protein
MASPSAEQRIVRRLIGHHGNRGSRALSDSATICRVGERDHQLIGADIERGDTLWRIGGGRRHAAGKHEPRKYNNATSDNR